MLPLSSTLGVGMGEASSAPAGERWMAVGRSANADSRQAGAEAARRALQGEHPKVLIVFGSAGFDAADLVAGIREAAPGVPVVGCSTNGEIAPDGPADRTVVVTAIGGDGFVVATACDEKATGRQRDAGALVARC